MYRPRPGLTPLDAIGLQISFGCLKYAETYYTCIRNDLRTSMTLPGETKTSKLTLKTNERAICKIKTKNYQSNPTTSSIFSNESLPMAGVACNIYIAIIYNWDNQIMTTLNDFALQIPIKTLERECVWHTNIFGLQSTSLLQILRTYYSS